MKGFLRCKTVFFRDIWCASEGAGGGGEALGKRAEVERGHRSPKVGCVVAELKAMEPTRSERLLLIGALDGFRIGHSPPMLYN